MSAHSAQITILKFSSNVTINTKIDLLIKDTKYTHDNNNIENFLASGSIDGKIKFWDIRIKNSCILNIKGHTLKVNDLDISPDLNYLVSGSDDKIVKVWDLRMNGNLLKEIKQNSQGTIECVNFHPSQSLIYYGSSDKTVRCWDIDTFQMMYQSLPEKQPIKHMQIYSNGFYTCTDSSVRKYEKINDNIGNVLLLKDSYEINWNRIHDFKYFKDKAILATTSFGKIFICWGLSLMDENNNYDKEKEILENKNNSDLIQSFYCKDMEIKRNSSVNKFKSSKKGVENMKIPNELYSNTDLKWRNVMSNISDLYDESNIEYLDDNNKTQRINDYEIFNDDENNYFNKDNSYLRDKIDDFEFKNRMLDEISLIGNDKEDSYIQNNILPEIKNNKTFINDESMNMSSLIKSYKNTENSFKKDYKLKGTLNFQEKYNQKISIKNNTDDSRISLIDVNRNIIDNNKQNSYQNSNNNGNNHLNMNKDKFEKNYDSDDSNFSLIEELKNIKCDENYSIFNTSNYVSNKTNNQYEFLNTHGNKSLSMIQKNDINANINSQIPVKLPFLKQNSKIEINIINNITTTNHNINDNRSFINFSSIMDNSLYKIFNNDNNTNYSNFNNEENTNNNDKILSNNKRNIKESKDLEIMGEIYGDIVSFKRIYDNRMILNQNILKNFKESKFTSCLILLNNTMEMTVIKEFLNMWFLRIDNKKYVYSYFQIFLIFILIKRLWKTKYATYHEICLISLIRMSNYLFDKLILEYSNFDNHVKDPIFKEVNNSKMNKELNDLIHINDNGESSRKEKVDFIISTFNYFFQSLKMNKYRESKDKKLDNVRIFKISLRNMH